MGVSENGGTPKSSIFNRVFHSKLHPFWGFFPLFFGSTPIFWQHFFPPTDWFPLAQSVHCWSTSKPED